MRFKKGLNLLLLPAITAVFFYFSLKGIGWGLPGNMRNDMALPHDLRNAAFYNLMIKERNDIYVLTGHSSSGRMPEKNLEGVTPIMKSIGIISKKQILFFNGENDILADFIRPYLLRSNHPDEQMTLAALAGMKPRKLDFNPRLFQYGGAYIYSLGAWLAALNKLNIVVLSNSLVYYFENPVEMSKIFMAGRSFNLLFGIAALVIIYRFTLKHFNQRAALMASLFYSIMPAIIFQVHVMKPYPLSMFFSLLALYFSFEIFDNPEKRKYYILCGVFYGLVIGSMSLYGLICVAPLTVFVLIKRRAIKNAPLFVAAAIVCFLITNPYWLLDRERLLTEIQDFSAGKIPFQFSRIATYLACEIPARTGVVFMFLAAGGIAAGVIKSEKKWIILVLSALIPIIVIAVFFRFDVSMHSVRLIIPWIAILCILAGLFVDFLLGYPKTRWIGYGFAAITAFELFAHSYICAENFKLDAGNDSTRLMAGRWIAANIAPGSRVGFWGLPEPFTVPPMDFRKYRVSVLFSPSDLDNLDYFICNGDIQQYLNVGGLMLEKNFKPYNSFLGLNYSMGSTSLNTEVLVYKIHK